MESQITSEQITNFWLKVYFDLSEGYVRAAVKRAYRDLNRTLIDLPKDVHTKKVLRKAWATVLDKKIDHLLNNTFPNQEDFDLWHQSTCLELRRVNDNYYLTQGQAQKWINMTLKYLFAMGEQNVYGISANYTFFHIPIDSYIMNILHKKGINKHEKPWSKIPDYDWYHNYQVQVRRLYEGRIPMDVEFELFNEVYNNIQRN